MNLRIKTAIIATAIFVIMSVVACGGAGEPTPDIDATVEAAVQTALAAAQPTETPFPISTIIYAIEDTYVVTNLTDPEDLQGLRGNNYGNLEFLKTWYAFGVVGDERIISIDLVKFDLAELKDKEIESAFIQLFARQADLVDNIRLVDVHLVRDPWSEISVTYDTRPAWDRNPIATTAVYGASGWYSWNVTGTVTSAARTGEVSFAVGLRTANEQAEEQVVFVSKEAGDNIPRLLVTYR